MKKQISLDLRERIVGEEALGAEGSDRGFTSEISVLRPQGEVAAGARRGDEATGGQGAGSDAGGNQAALGLGMHGGGHPLGLGQDATDI